MVLENAKDIVTDSDSSTVRILETETKLEGT